LTGSSLQGLSVTAAERDALADTLMQSE
jgi:hypothetical protein